MMATDKIKRIDIFQRGANGGICIAANKEQIPSKDLNELLEIIQAQYFLICAAWKQHFKVEDIRFYC